MKIKRNIAILKITFRFRGPEFSFSYKKYIYIFQRIYFHTSSNGGK